jgi:hypothetical protein
MPFEAAVTRERLAEIVDAPERDELLRGALEVYERLGATAKAEHVRGSLKRRG